MKPSNIGGQAVMEGIMMRHKDKYSIAVRRPDKEIEVIDSFFDGEPKTPLWYIGESIKLLGQADIAYFCKDWEKYRGCCIEYECCVRYSIKHVEEQGEE